MPGFGVDDFRQVGSDARVDVRWRLCRAVPSWMTTEPTALFSAQTIVVLLVHHTDNDMLRIQHYY